MMIEGEGIIIAVDGDGHDAIAGQVVGERHIDGDGAVDPGHLGRCVHGDGVEVGSDVDRRL